MWKVTAEDQKNKRKKTWKNVIAVNAKEAVILAHGFSDFQKLLWSSGTVWTAEKDNGTS